MVLRHALVSIGAACSFILLYDTGKATNDAEDKLHSAAFYDVNEQYLLAHAI